MYHRIKSAQVQKTQNPLAYIQFKILHPQVSIPAIPSVPVRVPNPCKAFPCHHFVHPTSDIQYPSLPTKLPGENHLCICVLLIGPRPLTLNSRLCGSPLWRFALVEGAELKISEFEVAAIALFFRVDS